MTWPAGLLRGPADLLDFLLPLWVGTQWGLSPALVGLLMAAEATTSLIGRPLAGMLVDRGRPATVAATGAALYALSFAGYALTPHPAGLFAAAAVGGVGGALAWVALRAMVAASAEERGRAFSELVSVEGTGTWIAFVAGLSVLQQVDYRGVFAGCAAACAVGAMLLARSGGRAGSMPVSGGQQRVVLSAAVRKLRPLLGVVVVTAAAEAGVGLLMLLHLQRGFGLDVGAIAAAFLPGFVVYTFAPPYLNRGVQRFGRVPVLTAALACSAIFAAGLAFAPNPWVISAMWIMAAFAWAAALPIQQAVVAEAAPTMPGKAMALYETAALVGVLIGSGVLGALYGLRHGWVIGCVFIAAGLLIATVLAPAALKRTGHANGRGVGAVSDRPDPARTAPAGSTGSAAPTEPRGLSAPGEPAGSWESHDETVSPDVQLGAAGAVSGQQERVPEKGARFDASNYLFHVAVWLIAQVGLGIAGYSWPLEALFGGPHDANWLWNDSGHWLLNVDRIWTAVLVLDTLYTLTRWALSRMRRHRDGRRAG
ncbi:MFS transporter [Nakamurella aerolata]|uniref:MFS transporter n=1 Tax=Nakamurella aerolata TaxID=1656892 RepID=UPI001BB2B792|nr:MFS transporter [Nakamurella aerolata]